MKTHYSRVDLKNRQLNGILNSIVYNVLPPDQVITIEDGLRLVSSNKDAPNDIKNLKGFVSIMKSLVADGYVKEIPGVHLQKWIESKF